MSAESTAAVDVEVSKVKKLDDSNSKLFLQNQKELLKQRNKGRADEASPASPSPAVAAAAAASPMAGAQAAAGGAKKMSKSPSASPLVKKATKAASPPPTKRSTTASSAAAKKPAAAAGPSSHAPKRGAPSAVKSGGDSAKAPAKPTKTAAAKPAAKEKPPVRKAAAPPKEMKEKATRSASKEKPARSAGAGSAGKVAAGGAAGKAKEAKAATPKPKPTPEEEEEEKRKRKEDFLPVAVAAAAVAAGTVAKSPPKGILKNKNELTPVSEDLVRRLTLEDYDDHGEDEDGNEDRGELELGEDGKAEGDAPVIGRFSRIKNPGLFKKAKPTNKPRSRTLSQLDAAIAARAAGSSPPESQDGLERRHSHSLSADALTDSGGEDGAGMPTEGTLSALQSLEEHMSQRPEGSEKTDLRTLRHLRLRSNNWSSVRTRLSASADATDTGESGATAADEAAAAVRAAGGDEISAAAARAAALTTASLTAGSSSFSGSVSSGASLRPQAFRAREEASQANIAAAVAAFLAAQADSAVVDASSTPPSIPVPITALHRRASTSTLAALEKLRQHMSSRSTRSLSAAWRAASLSRMHLVVDQAESKSEQSGPTEQSGENEDSSEDERERRGSIEVLSTSPPAARSRAESTPVLPSNMALALASVTSAGTGGGEGLAGSGVSQQTMDALAKLQRHMSGKTRTGSRGALTPVLQHRLVRAQSDNTAEDSQGAQAEAVGEKKEAELKEESEKEEKKEDGASSRSPAVRPSGLDALARLKALKQGSQGGSEVSAAEATGSAGAGTDGATAGISSLRMRRRAQTVGLGRTPKSLQELGPLERMSQVEFFNKMGDFGGYLVVDVRSRQDYYAGHVPRAVSIPVDDGEFALPPLQTSDANDSKDAMSVITARCSVTDQRYFSMNIRRHGLRLIVYGQDEPKENGFEAQFCLFISSISAPQAVYLLEGGYSEFSQRYPFLACKYRENEVRDDEDTTASVATRRRFTRSGHKHLPPFPWYPSEIIDGQLFLGNHVDAKTEEHLEHLGITHVLNVSTEVPNHFPDRMEYKNFAVEDKESVDFSKHFQEVFEYLGSVLESPRSRVLVHCHQGVSRSATVVIGYVMATRKWTLKKSYEFVKERRKTVFPNIGFWKQLARLEEELLGETTLHECVDMDLLEAELDAKQRSNAEDAEAPPSEESETNDEESGGLHPVTRVESVIFVAGGGDIAEDDDGDGDGGDADDDGDDADAGAEEGNDEENEAEVENDGDAEA